MSGPGNGIFAVMSLADAPPPNGQSDAAPGKYQDPFGSAQLRQWDGSRWTDRVQKLKPADAQPLAALTISSLIVPRPFRFSGTYRVVEEDGRQSFHVPGPRWLSRGLRVCDSDGVERAGLEPLNHWWLPFGGYKVLRGDVIVGRIRYGGDTSITAGKGVPSPIAAAYSDGVYAFIQDLSIVGRLSSPRGSVRPRSQYDLEIAQDAVDSALIVAVSVGIDQVNRAVFTGGGG